MTAQIAARFTPPPPFEAPARDRDRPEPPSSCRAHRTPSGADRLGRGALLLLAGGGAAAGWAVAAPAQAAELPPEAQQTEQTRATDADRLTGGGIAPGADTDDDVSGRVGTDAMAAEEPPSALPAPRPELFPVPDPLWSGQDPSFAAAETGDRDSAAPSGWQPPAAAEARGQDQGSASATSPAASIQDRLAQGTLTVRSGETLWSLTAELLGPDASAAEVARGWPQLWKANAEQIRDPDSVLAGTVLHVPHTLLPEQ